jgi:hypothetical protein
VRAKELLRIYIGSDKSYDDSKKRNDMKRWADKENLKEQIGIRKGLPETP